MKFVDNIPQKFIPSETEHVDHTNVVRALIDNKCSIQSFLPSFLEPGRINSATFDPNDPDSYSLSLYSSIEELNSAVGPIKSFWKRHNGYAVGFTTIKKGISTKADPIKGHISYFLYDTYGNNPCEDFVCLEIIHNEDN